MNKCNEIRRSVSLNYAQAVERSTELTCSCCSAPSSKGVAARFAGYGKEILASLPADAVANSFGCGNPVALAEIREGDTVLDLGSGAGIDILIAAKLAGPRGKVIGVDMTKAMVERARANAIAADLMNIDVREGIIEELPVKTGSIDLVISNCVINLSPEKSRVFYEIHRVLKPEGRISISDMVAEKLPEWLYELSILYSSCISGAIPEKEYLDGLRRAGLVEVTVRDRMIYEKEQVAALLDSEIPGSCCCSEKALSKDQIFRITDALAGKIASIRVTGRKNPENAL